METNDNTVKNLDRLVREIPALPKSGEEAHIQHITIDVKSGEVCYDPPFKLFGFQKFRHFELNTNSVLFNVEGPLLAINYENAPKPFEVAVYYDVKIAESGAFKLARFMNRVGAPVQLLNSLLQQVASTYIFQHKDFVINFSRHRELLKSQLTKLTDNIGLTLVFYMHHKLEGDSPVEFFDYQHTLKAKTNDGQVVEIRHDLALTLKDPIKYALSGIKDIKEWVRIKLDQFTSNAVIDMNYAKVLTNIDQALIKEPMREAVSAIGYELKQMISVPGLDNEKFNFETADDNPLSQKDYSTKDTKFKISVNIVIGGKLNLHAKKTKNHIKPDFDIIASMKQKVIGSVKNYIIEKTPDECFLNFNELEIELIDHVRKNLEANYGFNDLDVKIQSLESNLSDRFNRLRERPYGINFDADFKERNFELWFQVDAVSKGGWFRFRSNNYTDTQEELANIGRLVQNWMTTAMFRKTGAIDGKFILQEFKKVNLRVIQEFGLEIHIHDLKEGISESEIQYITERGKDNEEKGRRNEYLRGHEMAGLANLLQTQQEIKDIESEEEIRKINERIKTEKDKIIVSKEKLGEPSINNDFLLPPSNDDGANPLNT